MKKMLLVLALVILISGIFAVAALTQVQIERDISVSIASDIDPDVAVRFTVNAGYEDVAFLNVDNYIEFDLGGALATAQYFNTQAIFVIGAAGASNGVFTITNNSGIAITVDTVHGTGPAGVLTLLDSSGAEGPFALGSGITEEFHFRLNTAGAMAESASDPIDITATLVIAQQ